MAMLGARRHYAVPRLLQESGYLERFFTDSYVGNKPALKGVLKLIPDSLSPRVIKAWKSREDRVLDKQCVYSNEMLGIWYALTLSQAKTPLQRELLALEAAKRFNRWIAKKGLGEAQVVWGFGAATPELFDFAKKSNLRCIMEQIILPKVEQDKLLSEEMERWANWQRVRETSIGSSPMDGRQEAGWGLADAIVVGSEFVADGLFSMGVSREKIHVIPSGIDSFRFSSLHKDVGQAKLGKRPLRVLFAGAVGLRKGVPDLLHALSSFKPREVAARFAGGVELRQDKLQPFRPWAEFLGHVPRSNMSALFKWADVFVLPSIVEGSAMVIYEAIMSGCPVVTTPNAGSIITDEVDGFLVPIRSPEAIATALRRYLDEPEILEAHREALVETQKRAGLERYKADIVRLIRGLQS